MTDRQWEHIADILPSTSGMGRPRKHSIRQVIDAITYVLVTGCQWRALPQEYPPWQSVYYSFRRFQRNGTWEIPTIGSVRACDAHLSGISILLPVCSTANR